MPEFTNPTVRTVTAEDDCTRAVITVPKTKPKYLFLVIFVITRSRPPPVIRESSQLMVFMPKRKRASPLRIPVTKERICLYPYV